MYVHVQKVCEIGLKPLDEVTFLKIHEPRKM